MNIKGDWKREREREREKERNSMERQKIVMQHLWNVYQIFDKNSVGSNNFGIVSIINNLSKHFWSHQYVSTFFYVHFVYAIIIPLLIEMELHSEFC